MTSRAINNTDHPLHLHLKRKMNYMYNTDIFIEPKKDFSDGIYIVEGIIDCLSMIQMGIPDTIAAYGTSGIKKSLRDMLPSQATPIYIVFDNDKNKSGKRGANKAAWQLSEWGYCNTFILNLYPLKREKTDCNTVMQETEYFTKHAFWSYVDSMTRYITTDDYERRKQRQLKKTIKDIKNMYDETEQRYDDTLEGLRLIDVISLLVGKRIEWDDHIKCPFKDHTEEKGSFKTYPSTQSFYCFGCGRGGGILQFLKYYYGTETYKEAKAIFLREMGGRLDE